MMCIFNILKIFCNDTFSILIKAQNLYNYKYNDLEVFFISILYL